MLLEHGHAGDDTWFAASGEGMEFEVGGDEGGRELCICGCTGTSTPDLWGDVVKLLAILVMLLELLKSEKRQMLALCTPCLPR
jgi:hypothetical protein